MYPAHTQLISDFPIRPVKYSLYAVKYDQLQSTTNIVQYDKARLNVRLVPTMLLIAQR